MTGLRTAAQQALEALEAGPDVDPIFAGETEGALRAALAEYDKDRVKVEEMKANWALQRKLAEETQERDRQRREYEEQRLAALAEPVLQTCNCRWDGEMQMQQCTLHEAHVDAIKEWAQRAKFAEKKLAALAEQRLTDMEQKMERSIESLKTALAEPVQEPVATNIGCLGMPVNTPVTPPQRKPLTDEEIRDLWSWAMTAEAERTATTQQHAFARAVERAHGIT